MSNHPILADLHISPPISCYVARKSEKPKKTHPLVANMLVRVTDVCDITTKLAHPVANMLARGADTYLDKVCRNLSAVVDQVMRTQSIDQVPSSYEKISMRKKSFGILGFYWGLRDVEFACKHRIPCVFWAWLLQDVTNPLVQNQGGQKIYRKWCLYAPIFIFKICPSFGPSEADLSGFTNLCLPTRWKSTMLCKEIERLRCEPWGTSWTQKSFTGDSLYSK